MDVDERAGGQQPGREDAVVGGHDDAVGHELEHGRLDGRYGGVVEHAHPVPAGDPRHRAGHAAHEPHDVEPRQQRLECALRRETLADEQHPAHRFTPGPGSRGRGDGAPALSQSTSPTFSPPACRRTIGSGPTAEGRIAMWPGAGGASGHTGTAAADSASRSTSPQNWTSTAPGARSARRAASAARGQGCAAGRSATITASQHASSGPSLQPLARHPARRRRRGRARCARGRGYRRAAAVGCCRRRRRRR